MNSSIISLSHLVLVAGFGIGIGIGVGDAAALEIQLDYSTDTSNFFGAGNPGGASAGLQAREAMNAAAGFFAGVLEDDLDPIVESGFNSWTATFFHPSTGGSGSVPGLSVAADTLVIFVGARDLGLTTSGSSILGEAGPGAFGASGDSAWLTTIRERGEGFATSGASATEFAPWGGSIAIDSDTSWHYDYLSAPPIGSGLDDLYSVALHELGHVLGVGTADSWNNLVQDTSFTGSESTSVHGGQPDLAGGGSHWADSVSSQIYGSSLWQEAAFGPTLTSGTRKLVTNLDLAGLNDIGWDVGAAVPEPGTASMLGGLLVLSLLGRRRT